VLATISARGYSMIPRDYEGDAEQSTATVLHT
jgi:hypothetical protein